MKCWSWGWEGGKLQMNSSRSVHLSQDNELIPKRWEAKGGSKVGGMLGLRNGAFKSPNKTTELL